MNGYICFYKGKQFEIFADTPYEAQKQVEAQIRKTSRAKVKGYEISVILAEKDGKQVTHTPDF